MSHKKKKSFQQTVRVRLKLKNYLFYNSENPFPNILFSHLRLCENNINAERFIPLEKKKKLAKHSREFRPNRPPNRRAIAGPHSKTLNCVCRVEVVSTHAGTRGNWIRRPTMIMCDNLNIPVRRPVCVIILLYVDNYFQSAAPPSMVSRGRGRRVGHSNFECAKHKRSCRNAGRMGRINSPINSESVSDFAFPLKICS